LLTSYIFWLVNVHPGKKEAEEATHRIIFHVDMDQFYAAVEERERPSFKGKPVVVGADPKKGKGRGVVSTASYEARKYGIKSGMPISRAWKLCPDAIYVQPNFKLYIPTSQRIMAILKNHTEKLERWGLDEAFLDVSTNVPDLKRAKELAERIKREIFEQEGITCSIGVGPNKLVAKIASDSEKPNGLTIVHEKDVPRFLSPLPVRKLLWIGKKTERKLNQMGIKTVGELAAYDAAKLTRKFGVMGEQYRLYARGIDHSEVEERDTVKSISRETTFQEDVGDFNRVLETAHNLCREIIEELDERKLLCKTVTVKIRYANFETHMHGKTLSIHIDNLASFRNIVEQLLRQYLARDRKTRLIGVRASQFTSTRTTQKTLI
jgi:DNA polymerase IV (DinB-like DNA polymerase)